MRNGDLGFFADEVGEGAGVGVKTVDESTEEEENDGEDKGAGDEPVFVVEGTEVDEEDDDGSHGEEEPGEEDEVAGVDEGEVEATGVVAVEAALVAAHLEGGEEDEDEVVDGEEDGEKDVVPEEHEVPGGVVGEEGGFAFADGIAELVVAAGAEPEGGGSEANDEEDGENEGVALAEGDAAGLNEGAEAKVEEGAAEDGRGFEEEVVDEETTGGAPEEDVEVDDGEGEEELVEREDELGAGEAALKEQGGERPEDGHCGGEDEDEGPFHKLVNSD